MRGLIRNNFYAVSSSLKWTIGFCVVINVGVLLWLLRYSIDDTILSVLMLGQLGGFVGLTGTALQKDSTSKWSKYERTLPVKVEAIVLARYISFLMFSGIGFLFTTITVSLVSVFLTELWNPERLGYVYSFGVTFALLVTAILYPCVLKFGVDKVEILLMISIVITIGLFIGGSVVLAPYLYHLENGNTIFRVACISTSIVVFIASYFISLALSKRKEF